MFIYCIIYIYTIIYGYLCAYFVYCILYRIIIGCRTICIIWLPFFSERERERDLIYCMFPCLFLYFSQMFLLQCQCILLGVGPDRCAARACSLGLHGQLFGQLFPSWDDRAPKTFEDSNMLQQPQLWPGGAVLNNLTGNSLILQHCPETSKTT